MTEFGLEIISTVETEDGKPVEFSTSTSDKNLKKAPSPNQPTGEKNPEDEGRDHNTIFVMMIPQF